MPTTSLSNDFIHQFQEANDNDAKLTILRTHFELQPIASVDALRCGAQYYIQSAEAKGFLVQACDPPLRDGLLYLQLAIEETDLRPLPLHKFMKSAAAGNIHHLHRKIEPTAPPAPAPDSIARPQPTQAIEPTLASTAVTPETPVAPTELSPEAIAERDKILDVGAFTQLLDAAQRSGIVPGSSIITQLRDCEFRFGRYQQAMQSIESLLGSFNMNATQRQQRLLREDTDIASGRVKISPRDLQAKRIRDQQGNDAIERVRTRFSRVLDGLRLLIRVSSKADKDTNNS